MAASALGDIQIRDPFLLVVPDGEGYVLFGSTDPDVWSGPGRGFDCWTSADLVEWHGPIAAFRPPADFWSSGQFWAPEVYAYAGRWHMFATFGGPGVVRGTAVLVADAPTGPYTPWSTGAVTPDGWECLDGTLHIDAEGAPWMVFCHEWLQVGDGEVHAQRLTEDLRSAAGPPSLLFRASQAAWARALNAPQAADDSDGREHDGEDGQAAYVTDGPFLHRTGDGTLLMLWSSWGDAGYAMGVARSESGHVLGPWVQQGTPLWSSDGGHGMVARLPGGGLVLALHQPNETPRERAVILPLREVSGGIELARPHRAGGPGDGPGCGA
ncbi:glycoside hydrolase family 43 protein [Yinghuangia aomiensis]|uniref:Glycoside hydrolase family 43 protein n=1 Tax=Yinghuangia aomiensis TaxID=676205 RepID=A0ABP9HWL7_9ACTN